MNKFNKSSQKEIVGIAIKTTNQEASQSIPAHWEEFFKKNIIATIPNKSSDIVYALYTDFENEGVSNEGQYTFLIGCEVTSTNNIPSNLKKTVIPSAKYCIFDVEKGKPEKVFEKWMEIWQRSDLNKEYICDFEEYHNDGTIKINVGVK